MLRIKGLLLLSLLTQNIYAHRVSESSGAEKSLFKRGVIQVQVIDKSKKAFTPSRITVLNPKGKLVRLWAQKKELPLEKVSFTLMVKTGSLV